MFYSSEPWLASVTCFDPADVSECWDEPQGSCGWTQWAEHLHNHKYLFLNVLHWSIILTSHDKYFFSKDTRNNLFLSSFKSVQTSICTTKKMKK